jgi:hypothetical protein
MKKLILMVICGFILAMASMAWGSPFLVCTVDPAATNYLIKVNGTAAIEVPAPLHWDVGSLADGTYNLEVAAKNIWGESIFVPFDFNKALPGSPFGIGLSAE